MACYGWEDTHAAPSASRLPTSHVGWFLISANITAADRSHTVRRRFSAMCGAPPSTGTPSVPEKLGPHGYAIRVPSGKHRNTSLVVVRN